MRRWVSTILAAVLTALFAISSASPASAASLAGSWADFNGDGYSDLAVAAPFSTPGGTVTVIPGSASGLDTSGAVAWTRASSGAGTGTGADAFGSALAAGDFDGDGYSDLAIGAPGATVSVGGEPKAFAGVIVILRGSAAGLTATGSRTWSQESDGIHGVATRHEAFGDSLATGDINGDGWDDLVVGSPGNSRRAPDGSLQRFSGQVNVLYGSAAGLTAAGSKRYLQASPGVPGASAGWDRFGEAVAIGDANDDGYADLAVGTPFDGNWDVGSVNMFMGSSAGLTTTGAILLTQNTDGVPGVAEQGDIFGSTVVFGDHDDDGFADLVVGVPGEHFNARIYSSGQVQVFAGSADGLSTSGVQTFDQESDGVAGSPEPYDQFGRSLAVGDFNADGVDDLIVGAPEESIGDVWSAGAALTLHGGTGTGLAGSGNPMLYQGPSSLSDTSGYNEQFGSAIATGDFNGDGTADVAIGSPSELVGSVDSAGAVHVLTGSALGFVSPQFYEAGEASLPLGSHDRVGAAVAG